MEILPCILLVKTNYKMILEMPRYHGRIFLFFNFNDNLHTFFNSRQINSFLFYRMV